MPVCEYLHLSQSAAGRDSQRTAIIGSCLQAQHSTSNSVRVWCALMGWIPSCASHWSAIHSVSVTFLSLHFFREELIWVKKFEGEKYFMKVVGILFSPLESLTTGGDHLRFHYPLFWAFRLISPTLNPRILPNPRPLELSRGSFPLSAAAYFHSFLWLARLLFCLSHTRSCPSFPFFLPSPT